MSSQSEDRLVWIAIGLISGLSAVSAVVTVVNDGLVLTSAVNLFFGVRQLFGRGGSGIPLPFDGQHARPRRGGIKRGSRRYWKEKKDAK